jgi:hypothetical protein
MAKFHIHRTIKTEDRCWQYCVAPDKRHSEKPHGNIQRTHICSCGATKEAEINANTVAYSDWTIQAAQQDQF